MDSTLYNLVHNAVSKHADRIAVRYDNGEQHWTLPYLQLNDISALVMKLFHGRQSEVIGLCLYTDHRLPAILLAVLGCKAAFYNFDAKGFKYVLQVLKDIRIQIILVHQSFIQVIMNQITEEEAVCMPVSVQGLEDYSVIQFKYEAKKYHESNLAYCITTSGTTGKPKIVMVPNECIVPNILHLSELFSMTSDDLVLGATVLTFDPSIAEIFIAFSVGACLLIVPPILKMMPDRLLEFIHVRNKVTIMQITPSLFSRFSPCKLSKTILGDKSNVRVIALGGERFPSCTWLESLRSTNNQTCFYNLYGTTEVSCWATCFKVTYNNLNSEEIPIGEPLEETVLEVRDDLGNIVTEGIGKLWIGGSRRQCIIDKNDYLNLDNVVLRDTGDMVNIHDGNIFYIGRKDQQIKRNGRRMNLEEIKMIVRKHEYVRDLEVLLVDDQLIVFIVSSQANMNSEIINAYMRDNLPSHWWPDKVMIIANIPVSAHGKIDKVALENIFHNDRYVNRERIKIEDYLESIWKEHIDRTTSSIPETENFILAGGDSLKAVQLVNIIENMYNIQLPQLVDIVLHKTYAEVRKYLNLCVNKKLKMANGVENFENHKKQLSDTGNENQKHMFGFDFESDIEKIGDFYYSNEKVSLNKDENIAQEAVAMRRDVTEDDDDYKKNMDIVVQGDKALILHSNSSDINFHNDEKLFAKVKKMRNKRKLSGEKVTLSELCVDFNDIQFTIGRCGNCVYMYGHKTDCMNNKPTIKKGLTIDWLCKEKYTKTDNDRYHFKLKEMWKFDTGKCVDASPLLVVNSRGEFIMMIGSHSHRCSAIYGNTGEKLWETTLPDRIESSACLSMCGNFVIFGCYNGSVYFLHVSNGEIWWQFETGSQVKCSAVVESKTGLVYIGSHSQSVYCLDVSRQRVVWERNLNSGSLFSSPCISNDPHHLYIATLGGKMFALDPSNGETKWEFDFKKPVFSSPTLTSQGVCVGCTDMCLYHFSFNGTLLWKYVTGGHIFSSPCFKSQILSSSNAGCVDGFCVVTRHIGEDSINIDHVNHTCAISGYITFGCHDKYLYCITVTGKLCWKLLVDSAVYSSPFQCMINCDTHTIGDYCHSDNSPKLHISEGHVKQNTFEGSYNSISEQKFEQNQTEDRIDAEKLSFKKSEISNKNVSQVISGNDRHFKNKTDCEKHVVVFASTSGTLYVTDVHTGVIIVKHHLEGEIFSSPVVYGNTVIVGCRNDFVYCFEISSHLNRK